MRNLNRFLLWIALGVFAAASGYSQITTSGINGKVINPDGSSLPGATVIATHVPSGTQYGVATNTDGFFNIQGMRPGGPYSVDISFVGYSKKSFTEINLLLGEFFTLNALLTESSSQLGEVVVIGARPSAFRTEKPVLQAISASRI